MEKVLLVDDEKEFLEVMAERMAARGHECNHHHFSERRSEKGAGREF